MVPAAVISIGNKRGRRSAAAITALYPATVAIEDNASIDCARLILGTSSMLNSVTGRAIAASSACGASSGFRNPITTALVFSCA